MCTFTTNCSSHANQPEDTWKSAVRSIFPHRTAGVVWIMVLFRVLFLLSILPLLPFLLVLVLLVLLVVVLLLLSFFIISLRLVLLVPSLLCCYSHITEPQRFVSFRPPSWSRHHGGRPPSSDDSFHTPTVIPPSALDKPSIMKRYHSRRTCSHTSPRRLPTMVTLHDTRFVEWLLWNDG